MTITSAALNDGKPFDTPSAVKLNASLLVIALPMAPKHGSAVRQRWWLLEAGMTVGIAHGDFSFASGYTVTSIAFAHEDWMYVPFFNGTGIAYPEWVSGSSGTQVIADMTFQYSLTDDEVGGDYRYYGFFPNGDPPDIPIYP